MTASGPSVADKSGQLLPPLLDALDSPLNLGEEVLRALVHPRGSALTMGPQDSPSSGSTLCLGQLPLRLEYGDFKVFAFETTSFGRHVLAVTMGDISTVDPLLIRMHSECVTSETLRGCDCDCVEQLNAALKNIAEEGRGILFYFRQEGRGVGYSCKSRDRMAVAASEDSLGTFDVYKAMGLEADPRSYEFMPDLVNLLGLSAPVNIMTNNPHKLEAVETSGLRIHERRPLIVPANPCNLFYLQSKSSGGHMFDYDTGGTQSAYPWPVEAFQPYVLTSTPGAMRFVHMASYPLPIRPMEGVLVLDPAQVSELAQILGGTSDMKIEPNAGSGRFKVTLDREMLAAERQHNPTGALSTFIGMHPYWFNDHVYHDRIDHLDFVALTYNQNPEAMPVVRVQSENLFQRFPVRAEDRSTKYEKAMQEIVDNGRGMMLLYPEDGRGKGFSALFLEKFLVSHGLAQDNNEAIAHLGCKDEQRDFRSIATLIKHHYSDSPIQLLLGSSESASVRGLKRHGINIASSKVLSADDIIQ